MLMNLLNSYGTYTPAAEGVIGSFKFNYFPTLAIAAIVIFLGRFFVRHSAFLRKSALPAPVVSGLLFSIIVSCIKVAGFQISFETTTLKDLAQNLFFAGVGFAFTAGMLKKSGKKLVINIAIGAVLLITLQNVIGIGVGRLVGLHPLLALQCSSSSMSGGVATAAAMGPFYESLGVQDAAVVGIACGTLGNIMASLIGGPVAVALIKKHKLKADPNDQPHVTKKTIHELNTESLIKAFAITLLLALGAVPITWLFGFIKINMPICISCIFAGAIVRSVCDAKKVSLPTEEIEALEHMWLQLYLALIMMSTDFTKLAPLAGQVAIIVLCQAIFICLFGYFVSFNLFGRDYGAAVMTAGNIGWGSGSATNCVANEKAVMDEYGWHSIAWDLYPGWSVICDDLYNPAILSILGTIFA